VGFFHLLVPKTSEVRVGTKLLFKSSRAIPMGWLLGSLAPWLLGSSAPRLLLGVTNSMAMGKE
jgi:hypothetical protein